MNKLVFCTVGDTRALYYARKHLLQWGYSVVPAPSSDATHLLLPVPSLEPDGSIKGGPPLEEVLKQLPANITVLGGNLPEMPHLHYDFLKDEFYLEENAAITARCTEKLMLQQCNSFQAKTILIIGWGRIGKQLAALLKRGGAAVTVAARKEADLQALAELGYTSVQTRKWDARQYDIIINTAPIHLLDEAEAQPSALLVDLASTKGITGSRVIWARGLPNKEAPEKSGLLIAKTALRYALGKEFV
jgi:hypothetical protein